MATKPTNSTVDWASGGVANYPASAIETTGYEDKEELPAEEFNGIIQRLGDWTVFLDAVFGNFDADGGGTADDVGLTLGSSSNGNSARLEYDPTEGSSLEDFFRVTNVNGQATLESDFLSGRIRTETPQIRLSGDDPLGLENGIYAKLGTFGVIERLVDAPNVTAVKFDHSDAGGISSFETDVLALDAEAGRPAIEFFRGPRRAGIDVVTDDGIDYELDFESSGTGFSKLNLGSINLRGEGTGPDQFLSVNDDTTMSLDRSSRTRLDIDDTSNTVSVRTGAYEMQAGKAFPESSAGPSHTNVLTRSNTVKAVVRASILTGERQADGSTDLLSFSILGDSYNVDGAGGISVPTSSEMIQPGGTISNTIDLSALNLDLLDPLDSDFGAAIGGVNVQKVVGGDSRASLIPVRGYVLQDSNTKFNLVLESYVQYNLPSNSPTPGWYPTFVLGQDYIPVGGGSPIDWDSSVLLDPLCEYIFTFTIWEP